MKMLAESENCGLEYKDLEGRFICEENLEEGLELIKHPGKYVIMCGSTFAKDLVDEFAKSDSYICSVIAYTST